jgi:protease-4
MPVKHYIEIDLAGSIAEARPPFSLFGGGPRYTLREILDRIEHARQARDIKAILLRCGDISTNLAVLDELHQALLDFRKSGKKVIAYVEDPLNKVYYLASAADYIVLTPNGYVGLVGFKSEVLFLGGTLEKVGVDAKYVRVGKYKSAAEQVAHKTFTEPGREAYNAVLDDVYDKFVGDIAAARGWSVDETLDIIDNGPYIPSVAYREGLVDTIAYWDEVPEIIGTLAGVNMRKISYGKFAKRRLPETRWDEPPKIGIVYGVGSILSGRNRRNMLLGDIMGSETITEAFKAMREDKSVKAVIFRIDSGGGEMTASDKIRREVELTAKKKPVIVSMGGVAGSGGYHIACDGTEIMADEATITGSIGVLSLWFHTKGLYEKIGVNKDIFTRGEHADFYPTWREVTDEDMDRAQWYVQKYYDKFIADVAKGRSMGVDEVHEVAQGRIWSGKQAEEIGLIDKVGGLRDAIKMARRQAGIPDDEEVSYRILPGPGGFLEALMSSATARVTGKVEVPDEVKDMLKDAAYREAFDEPVLYLMPYEIEIE